MAKKITAQAAGGKEQILDSACKVRDALAALKLEGNYTATVNGEPADMADDLRDYDFVAFTESVKGGR